MKICGLDASMNSTGKCIFTVHDDTFDILGLTEFSPGVPLTLVMHHNDGDHELIKVNHTYNEQQIEWFKRWRASFDCGCPILGTP